MVKNEKDKGIEGYGEAGGYVYENTYRKSIYVKRLLVFMLAPPAGYIPRHCRGTPFKRGRCRRDACNLFFGRYKRTAAASPLFRGVRRSRGVCIVKHIQKVHIIKGLLIFVLAPPAGYIPRHCRGTPFKRERCRRDAYLDNCNADVVTLETIFIDSTLPMLRLDTLLMC